MIDFLLFTAEPKWVVVFSVSIVLLICFLQSGIDKVIDRKGNLKWLNDHFSSTIFKGFVPLLLMVVTILELLTSLLLFLGIIGLNIVLIQYGLALSLITFICLFSGQRIAKDYVGAYVLVVYIILTLLGIWSFTL